MFGKTDTNRLRCDVSKPGTQGNEGTTPENQGTNGTTSGDDN
jgi:hypothetical protein